MKYLLSLITACLFTLFARGQELIDTAGLDFSAFKGKLICVNEMHGVKTNDLVYTELIKKLTSVAKDGDTINLILETTYSRAYLYNRWLESGGRLSEEGYFKKFITDLKNNKVPIKVIGVDFEYDEGKRAESYIAFLNSVSSTLSDAGVPVTALNEYTKSLNSKDLKQQSKDRKSLIDLYNSELLKWHDNKTAITGIKELLLVLNAKHQLHSNRDPVIYRRLMEAHSEGLINYEGKFNLLIHGSAHMTPGSNSLFDLFNESEGSPFFGNVSLVAQTYYNCSCRDYFTKAGEHHISSSCFFHKDNKEFMEYLKTRYQFKENAASSIRRDGLPLSPKLKNSILYLYVHNEVS